MEIKEILVKVPVVCLYQIPSIKTNINLQRAADWLINDPFWEGSLEIHASGEFCCRIQFLDSEGNICGFSFLKEFPSKQNFVPVKDSTRYFTIQFHTHKGLSALLGLGFYDRKDSNEVDQVLRTYFAKASNVSSHRQRDIEAVPRFRSSPLMGNQELGHQVNATSAVTAGASSFNGVSLQSFRASSSRQISSPPAFTDFVPVISLNNSGKISFKAPSTAGCSQNVNSPQFHNPMGSGSPQIPSSLFPTSIPYIRGYIRPLSGDNPAQNSLRRPTINKSSTTAQTINPIIPIPYLTTSRGRISRLNKQRHRNRKQYTKRKPIRFNEIPPPSSLTPPPQSTPTLSRDDMTSFTNFPNWNASSNSNIYYLGNSDLLRFVLKTDAQYPYLADNLLSLKCHTCYNIHFANLFDMEEHWKTRHSRPSPFKCIKCQLPFFSHECRFSHMLRSHMPHPHPRRW